MVIRDVVEKRARQDDAAEGLGIGVRQVKRRARGSRERGTAGLASGHRGRRPNNAIDDVVRREVLKLVRARHPDFGPTFARAKLVGVHGRLLSVETPRGWMITDGLWRATARRAVRMLQSRPRRECVGDLVQIDGSPHDWFGGRGPECTLIVLVDDATTRHRRHRAGNAYLPEFMVDFNRRFAVAPRNPEDWLREATGRHYRVPIEECSGERSTPRFAAAVVPAFAA